MSIRLFIRCRVLHRHRWVTRVGPGDENFVECRDCKEAFSGAPPTGESKYSVPAPLVGRYRDR